jgi:hypothetical protein
VQVFAKDTKGRDNAYAFLKTFEINDWIVYLFENANFLWKRPHKPGSTSTPLWVTPAKDKTSRNYLVFFEGK